MADLVEDREAVVEEVVEHLVEQAAGALREQLLAERLVLLAAVEEPRHRQQLDARQRHEVVGADEDVELGGVQALDRAVVDREVEDAEEVALVGVVVDLRPLALRHHVLDVERMPAETVGELLRVRQRRRVEVDPGEAGGAELSGRRRTAPRRRPRFRARGRDGCEAGSASVLNGSSITGIPCMFAILAALPASSTLSPPTPP